MDTSTIKFEVLRDGARVTGFKLTAAGESEAESFCFSFPSAYAGKKAVIKVCTDKLVFEHSGFHPGNSQSPLLHSDGGEYSVELPSEDLTALGFLLISGGPYKGTQPRVEHLRGFGKGFELKVI